MAKEKMLPNPDAKRFPVVDNCLAATITIEETKMGVTKTIEIDRPECNKVFDGVCVSYENPAIMWKRGCPLASNKIERQEEAVKINPLKASKRARRKGK